MERITARKNTLIVHIKRLIAERAYRRESGEFVCEGPKLLDEALRHGAQITTLVQSETATCPDGIAADVRRVCVPDALLAYLSDTKSPQQLLFLCRLPPLTPPQLLKRGHYLLLDGLQDPGNVGTIWRTADAFGAEGLLLLPGCADPFSPKVIRAGMGVCFRLPLWELSQEQLLPLLNASDLPLYATALREDSRSLARFSLAESVVAIGSEGRGVSESLLALCAGSIRIPMRAQCESLNAAVAASVVLWEIARESGIEGGLV